MSSVLAPFLSSALTSRMATREKFALRNRYTRPPLRSQTLEYHEIAPPFFGAVRSSRRRTDSIETGTSNAVEWAMPSGALPTGTVTFLFTDIEGSSKLWETHQEVMRVSLARHDAVLRQAIGGANGHVFKTMGDAFCAVFPTVSDALDAVLAAQLALNAENWPESTPIRVRMVLHTGAVESRDDDYFGPAVNRVARLLATAHGGQVLVSASTQELARDHLPKDCSLRGLGEHRLKDLGRPEGIFQLLHPDLPDEFPPLRTLISPDLRHNLPQQLTSFVGRQEQIANVRALMEQTRLLTLTGSGGSGKTRLALQVAADMLNGTNDGVWLVELAPLTDPSLVPSTIADVLGLKEEPGKPIQRTLVDHVKSKDLLLILDNCEHLLTACAQFADLILRQCPAVLIIATSRESLGIFGELSFQVPSLTLPDPEQPQTPESLTQFEAGLLFIERARFHLTQFEVTLQNAPAIASICHRLDGIPLAIELAAARVKTMTVEEISHRLDQRFRLLTGGSRVAIGRQQTLRSLIDWSYDLLSPREKALFCRLSVFSGGWSMSAAEAVCAGDPITDLEVMDTVSALVDKNLVICHQVKGATRYGMLETFRQYAQDRLYDLGETQLWRDRQLSYCIALLQQAPRFIEGASQRKWFETLESEHDNLRAALQWASDQDNPLSLMTLVAGLDYFWIASSRISEGNNWVEMALAKETSAPPSIRSQVLEGGTMLAFFRGDYEEARCRASAGCLAAREDGDPWQLSLALFLIGISAVHGGRDYEAKAASVEGTQLALQVGDAFLIGRHLVLSGLRAWAASRYSEARDCFRETVAISRTLEDDWHAGISCANLAIVTRLSSDLNEAASIHEEGLHFCRAVGDRQGVSWHLAGMAGVYASLGEPVGAAYLIGAVQALVIVIGSQLPLFQQRDFDQTIELTIQQLGSQRFEEISAQGRGLEMDRIIEIALDSRRA